jgi:epoxyqueuosine reductase QueG
MKRSDRVENPAGWIEKTIKDYINSPENTLKNPQNEAAWEEPLVGFSRGDDPIFEEYKRHIGEFYWTPLEIFSKTFPAKGVNAGELTVISWVLPQTEKTKADLRKETVNPAERWARARIFGEEVNVKLRKQVAEILQAEGFEAVAPMLSPFWQAKESERYGFASTWSERHAAYASGLGTFGLCDGLITPRGKAMRCGSVVARIRIPATARPYKDHHEYCLFFSKGLCGKCIKRCPANAVSEAGHDKKKCLSYAMWTAEYVKKNFGFEGYGCGFCQTGVPCESKIPLANDPE